MSHFVGIVFGNDISELLAPYDEQLVVDEYIDKTAKELREWAEERVTSMRELVAKYKDSEDSYRRDQAEGLQDRLSNFNNFETEEDYQRYIESLFNLDEDGNSLSTYNPQSKWDWYVEGGRWSGEILHAGDYDTNQACKEDLTKIDTPYCFVDLDGNWHERGSMGWWGLSYGDKPEEEWEKEFRDYLKSVPNDTLLTVIDFHI